ncbi:MAG TPA: SRPBCC family protein [Thermoplasmata archaeon]|nr:SRPBCC family protein [Thermoplasmata archaeon]
MARINDEERSHFDAPIEVVWKYLQDPQAHGASHQGTRNRAMKPLTDTSFVVSWEQNMNGNWVKVANKITVFPPLGMAAESIEGPMTGSRMFTVYTPRGSKTEVAVYGDMQSPMIPADQLEGMVRMAWENAYNEDAAGIRAFAKK